MENINLSQIERILFQSLNGLHLLFDHKHVAEVLRIPTEDLDFFCQNNLDRLQDLFFQLIELKNYTEKISYIHELDAESYEMLLRGYFHILDNTAQISSPYQH